MTRVGQRPNHLLPSRSRSDPSDALFDLAILLDAYGGHRRSYYTSQNPIVQIAALPLRLVLGSCPPTIKARFKDLGHGILHLDGKAAIHHENLAGDE